jgi:hypothetical protein
MRLGLGGELRRFIQIHRAPWHFHREDVFF